MNKVTIIAGPCSVESREQIIRIAKKLKELGVDYLRGGCFKPRTDPDTFQGLGELGLDYLIEAKEITGLPIVTELMTVEQVRKYARYIDIIQIGARNMYNYDLLKEVGKLDKPVLLKRGLSATYKEWLLACKYITNNGNNKVILCERGIRTFEGETRNTFDIEAVPYIKHNSNFKIYVDIPENIKRDRFYIRAAERGLGDSADIIYSNANKKASFYIRPCKDISDIVLSGAADRIKYKNFLNKIIGLIQEIYY